MKKLFTFFAALAVVGTLAAQLPNNSIAPNFTATDINGVTYNLYEILESGKPVVMDVSATWCGPCWNYHNGHALKDIYEQYGPAGTNELMVLFIEGDGSTNTACLSGSAGCNSSTQGNWVADTPYPIIDDASIADAYDIGYFPTVYLMCPNHLVSEVGQLSASALKAKADACPEPKPGADITAITFDTDYAFGKICGTQTLTPSFLVVNSGTDSLKSVVVELRVNGQLVQTYEHTTPIPSFFPQAITLDPVTVTGNTIVKATITSLNGTVLATPISKQKSYPVAKKTETKSLTLDMLTDGYGMETYWELIDEAGTVYASGGNENVGPNGANTGTPAAGPGSYANNANISETFEVPADGCYLLHMVDSYGDGMCFQASGFYKLYETAAPTNVLANGGCNFADALTIFGADGIVGVNDLVEAGSMRVFPNPTTDLLNVNFSMKSAADVQMTISNALGQVVRDLGTTTCVAGQNAQTVKVGDLAAGVYMLSLRTAEGTVTRTFSVN